MIVICLRIENKCSQPCWDHTFVLLGRLILLYISRKLKTGPLATNHLQQGRKLFT